MTSHGAGRWAVLTLLLAVAVQLVAARPQKPKFFLQKQLPLSLVLTTPVELAKAKASDSVLLSGRQTLTAVFSRPVIALGSDFGTPASEQKLPFRLSCPMPGKARWVTTTIARFDPDTDWPSDLDCELAWTAGLTSYDGAPFQLGTVPARRPLSSNPLQMYLSDVLSEATWALTDSLWASMAGPSSEHEVPPGAKILLGFTYPVHLEMLKSVLKVAEGASGTGAEVAFDVGPCQSPARWLFMAGTTTTTGTTTPLSLDVNATCVELTPKNLKPDTVYAARLPKGARYNALAGPLRAETAIKFRGLRPFKIYFQERISPDVWSGTRYRRMDLWLLHGLSPDTPVAALAARVGLCELAQNAACTPVPFSLALVSKGRARLSVPSLKPGTQYRISVDADNSVKDGYNQGLQASSVTFWTSYVPYSFAAPVVNNMAVLESGVDGLEAWPYITRGPPPLVPNQPWNNPVYANRVDSWEVDLADERTRNMVVKMVVQSSYTSASLESVFGPPTTRLPVPSPLRTAASGADWAEVLTPLTDAKARIVSFCCNNQGAASDAKLVLKSSLSFNVIKSGSLFRAWVLDSSAAGSGPVAGATVFLHHQPYGGASSIPNTGPDPVMLGTCTTGADGVCAIDTVSAGSTYNAVSGFAVAGDRVAMLPDSGFTSAPAAPPPYAAALVADRRVVVPGDKIKVTGFVQQASATGLSLPAASWAVLEVSPGWQSSGSGASGGMSDGGSGGGITSPGRGMLAASATSSATSSSVSASSGGFAGSALSFDPVMADVKPAMAGGADAVSLAVVEVVEGMEVETRPGRVLLDTAIAGSSAASAGMADTMMGMPIIGGGSGAASGNNLANVPTRYYVKVDAATGTLHSEIPIPEDARLQPYSFLLRLPPPGKDVAPASGPQPSDADVGTWSPLSTQLSFTVADPRPPTAELKVEVPPWVLPNATTVSIKVTAVSYIGASVDNAPITITWKHAKAADVIKLTTDLSGVASASLDLGALPEANRTEAYDTLTVNVEWVGPTRELIKKSATVILADGPARLALSLSLTTDLPGASFALGAALTSNADGSPLPGLPVTATLKPDPADPWAGAACADTPSCTTTSTSGGGVDAGCQLALPCVGRFVLEACAEVPASGGAAAARVCGRQKLGRNVTQWVNDPLDSYTAPTLSTDKSSYKLGETVQLTFQSSWPGARLLVLWGNDFVSKYTTFASLATGLVSRTIGPLGPECAGGCSIFAVLDVPRRPAAGGGAPALPPPEQLLVSKLFDPAAPLTFSMSTTLIVLPDNGLAVGVTVAAAPGTVGATVRDVDGAELLSIEPGAEAQISVSVQSGSGAAVGSAEVTVYGVDKAFLDLLPYDLPHPEKEVVLRLYANIMLYGIDEYRLAPGAVRAVYDKLMSRLTGLDPWLPTDTLVSSKTMRGYNPYYYSTRPGGSAAAAVDTADPAYVALFTTELTYMPYFSSPCYNCYEDSMAAAGPDKTAGRAPTQAAGGVAAGVADSLTGTSSGAESSGGSGGGSSTAAAGGSSVAVRQESSFVVTPLFTTVVTDAGGKATVTFKAPQNLGAFVIRAFAASGSSARYGSGESKLAVRRALSLTPSVPRFVRVGDIFEAGVVVTVGSAPAAITVTLKVEDAADSPLTLVGTASKTATFVAGGGLQQEVRFSFSAAAIGSANLTFSAGDGSPGGASDGLQLDIPVYGQQGDVWVATSFALTALPASDSDVVQWQEGIQLPDAVPGSGGLALIAGVGYFPAVASMYDNLLLQEENREYAYAQPAMLWATQPPLLSVYGQPAGSANTAVLSGAYSDLAALTYPVVGLVFSSPSRWYSWTPTWTDMSLNTWALFLAAFHGPAGRALSGDLVPYAADWSRLESSLVPVWRQAVERQLIQDAVDARTQSINKEGYSNWYTLAWARLVLGGSWTPSGDNRVTDTIRADLSLDALIKAATKKAAGRETRVLLSLLLQAMGSASPAPDVVSDTVDELTSALRTQGRTAYVASGPGAAGAASHDEQALALLLLLRSGATHQLLPKLAAHVANPSAGGGGGSGRFAISPSYMAQGLAAAALSEYDKTRGSTKPDVELAADVNGLTVLEATFRTGSNKPVSNTTTWENLPNPPAGSPSELSFEVTGSGEVSVAASLHYVPSALLAFPTYRGLYVEGALQMVDPLSGSPTGGRLAAVPLGSVVAYTLQLTSPDDLGAVTLSVMMPGGLEPLDPNLVPGVDSSCTDSFVDTNTWGAFWRWYFYFPICPAQETRPSVVTFNYLQLRAGTSTVVIKAVAATAGTFVVPPVRAWADNQPELMGSTAGAKLTVCAACASPTYGALPPPPKPCPADCSGNGVCNLKTGKCVCNEFWTRADCSRAVA